MNLSQRSPAIVTDIGYDAQQVARGPCPSSSATALPHGVPQYRCEDLRR
jgi:hypothetical protein